MRPEPDQPLYFGDVRNAARHVFKALFIGFAVGDIDNFGLGAGDGADPLGERDDGDLFGRSDVEDLADGVGVRHQLHQRADHVADIREAARLLPGAIDGQRPPGHGLLDQGGNDHAVLAGLARSDGIEQPHHHGRQLLFAPIGEGQKLVDRFRTGVTPPTLRRRAHDQVAVFPKRHLVAQPVDLGGRRDQHFLFLLVRHRQDHFGAADVGLDGAHRTLDDQFDAHGGGKVENDVARVHQLREQRQVLYGIDCVVEPRVLFDVGDVVDAAGGEVVDDEHLVSASEIGVGEM